MRVAGSFLLMLILTQNRHNQPLPNQSSISHPSHLTFPKYIFPSKIALVTFYLNFNFIQHLPTHVTVNTLLLLVSVTITSHPVFRYSCFATNTSLPENEFKMLVPPIFIKYLLWVGHSEK